MFKKKTQLSQAKAKEFSKWIKAFNVNFFLPKFKRNYLESPLDNKEIQPVKPKEINPEYSLDGLILKLKLQYFGHLMRRTDSLEKTLMLGKIEEERRRR